MKIRTKMILASICLSLTSLVSLAQVNPPPPMPPPPPGLPIDTSVWILLAAGLFLGIYRIVISGKSTVSGK